MIRPWHLPGQEGHSLFHTRQVSELRGLFYNILGNHKHEGGYDLVNI